MVNQEKKKWDWKHMLYDEMRNWAMWNCTKWMIWEKKELIDIEKDAHKGKMIDMKKKMPKWEKNVMKKMKMVYLLLIFLFRQLNELSILIEIVWIGVMISANIEMMEYVVNW